MTPCMTPRVTEMISTAKKTAPGIGWARGSTRSKFWMISSGMPTSTGRTSERSSVVRIAAFTRDRLDEGTSAGLP